MDYFNKHYLHIRVLCDNMTVIIYINDIRVIKSESCKQTACNIWAHSITPHILGVSNKEADKQFRIFYDTTDWKLNPEPEIKEICEKLVKPEIELFASRINKQSDKGQVTYRFLYAKHHNDANKMTPPPTVICVISKISTKSIVF